MKYRNHLASFILAAAALIAPGRAMAQCTCNIPATDALLTAILASINTQLGALNVTAANQLVVLGDINKGVSATNSSVAAHQSTTKQVADAANAHATAVSQANQAVESRMYTSRSFTGAIPRDACETANRGRNVGRGTTRASNYAKSLKTDMQRAARSTKAPEEFVALALNLKPKEVVPEYLSANSGTVTNLELQQLKKALVNQMPPAPVSPSALPAAFKGKPQAREYEALFKAWETKQNALARQATRDIELLAPTIEATPEQISAWQKISGVSTIPKNQTDSSASTDNGASIPADDWNTLRPVRENGKLMISERDFLRTEMMRRTGDPDYIGKKTSEATPEMLMKEQINLALLNTRMNYEIMTALLHSQSREAISAAWDNYNTYAPQLAKLEADMRAR